MTPEQGGIFRREPPLLSGVLVRRYKRFFADIELKNGEVITAHCVNTGAMEGLTTPGTPVCVSRASNPKRKLKFTWELAKIDGAWIGVDTSLPNRTVHALLESRMLPWLADFPAIRREVPYGQKSRVDFLLEKPGHRHYLEVKNCHLVYPDRYGYFPDCVSTRAAGHLRELMEVTNPTEDSAKELVTAEVLFFVQTPGVEGMRPSDLHDPEFAATARLAASHGVAFSAVAIRHEPDAMIFDGIRPVDLKPYDLEPIRRFYEASRG